MLATGVVPAEFITAHYKDPLAKTKPYSIPLVDEEGKASGTLKLHLVYLPPDGATKPAGVAAQGQSQAPGLKPAGAAAANQPKAQTTS